MERVERLTHDDNLFLLMEQVLGTPVTGQFLWEFPTPLDDATAGYLRDIGAALGRGRLARRVVRPWLGRDYWLNNPDAGRVSVATDVSDAVDVATPGAVEAWVDRELRAAGGAAPEPSLGLDSIHGPAWLLSAVPTTSGGFLVMISATHTVADGSALVLAITEAIALVTKRKGAQARMLRSRRATAVDNARDQVTLLGRMVRSGYGLWRAGRDARKAQPESTPAPAAAKESAPVRETSSSANETTPCRVPGVTYVCDGPAFAARAKELGGSVNVLFTAITTGVAFRTGLLFEGVPESIAIPMSGREDADDLRANASRGASVKVTLTKALYNDLSPLKDAMKAAYAALGEGPKAADYTFELVQGLPDILVRALAKGAASPRCLASNMGRVTEPFADLGLSERLGKPVAAQVAARTVMIASSREALDNREDAVNAWACATQDQVVLSFTGAAYPAIADAAALAAIVEEELQRWGVTATRWF